MWGKIKSLFREKQNFELLVMPDERLKQVCEPVTVFDEKLFRKVISMGRFMFVGLPWGSPAGLAAPQLGQNIRLFVTNAGADPGGKSGNFRVFINPVIIWKTKAPKQAYREGCFSLEPENYDYRVMRYTSIKIRFQDVTGAWQEERFNGQSAQVIQHEMDHLDGVLVCDYERVERKGGEMPV